MRAPNNSLNPTTAQKSGQDFSTGGAAKGRKLKLSAAESTT